MVGVLRGEYRSEPVGPAREVPTAEAPCARGVKRNRPGIDGAGALFEALEDDVPAGVSELDGSRERVHLTGANSGGRAHDRHTDANLVRVAAPKGRAPCGTPLRAIEGAPVGPDRDRE